MRRLATAALVLGVCALAFVLAGAGTGAPRGKKFNIELDNAFGLAKGGDLKIAGVRAGKTPDFDITPGPQPKAIVHAEITTQGMADLRADAHCDTRPQSFIGEYYVDCIPGTAKQPLKDGATIPVSRTTSTIPADLVADIMRMPYRERLRLIIAELGAGLAGRPQDLSQVLHRAVPGLRETTKTLQILGRQTSTIERFIGNSDTVLAALARRKTDVSRFVHEARNTAEITASRRGDLAATFARLPEFLAELRPYMSRLGDLTVAQTPVLRNLRASSGDLDTFLRRLGPFTVAGRPALKRLGRASAVGIPAIRLTSKDVAELSRLGRITPALAKPLRQFLTSIDDRRRAVEPDPRAAQTGPPAPDPTHIRSGSRSGFTGMEALWDYFYWQALATNALDNTGHVLRLNAIFNECSQYQVSNKGNEALFDRCNQWLGPHQPGITTPDPTQTGAASASSSTPRLTSPASLRSKAASSSTRRKRKAPKPSLPAPIQKLLASSAAKPKRTPAPSTPPPSGSRSDTPLLNYLLSP